MRRSILVAEDDASIRAAIAEYLRLEGWELAEAQDGLEAKRLLQERPFDVLLTDIRMPGLDGHGLFAWVRESGPGLPVVFMTAHGDLEDAVRALKLGAADYIAKPFDLDELGQRLLRAIELRTATGKLRAVEAPAASGDKFLIPSEGPLAAAYALAAKAAAADATVLIQGESGTGKELLARFVHDGGPRRDGPFVAINAGAIPEGLVESELFGFEKGAFSGADRRRLGYFEAAQHGTVFLDEIGELPPAMQVKLLRVLQERTLNRLGGGAPVPLDVRVVAATNRDLAAMVKEGSFREDLYYRLQVLTVRLPPLRERPGDIEGLAAFILRRAARRLGVRPEPRLSPAAIDALRAYPFPGNVRELENMLERALIVGSGAQELGPEELGLPTEGPGAPRAGSASPTGGESGRPAAAAADAADAAELAPPAGYDLASWERYAVERALARCDGNRTKAAELLGIGRRTLQEKLKSYGLDRT